MFSPPILSRLTEDLRLSQALVDNLEQRLAEARAEVAEWSRLIELAQDVQLAPAGVLVAPAGQKHDLDIRFGATLPADRVRGQADWCLCGQPQTLGMVHSLTRCYEGELDLTPALPQPGSLPAFKRGFFAPYTETTERGATT